MNDGQILKLTEFSITTQACLVSIEIQDKDNQNLSTQINCVADRDASLRAIGLTNLPDSIGSRLLAAGREGVFVLFKSSDEHVIERYPIGEVILLKKEDRDRMTPMANYSAVVFLSS